MASTMYEREAKELALSVVDQLNERTGGCLVFEGSTWRRKYLRIADPGNGWKTVAEFTGNRWEDVYLSLLSVAQMLEYFKED